MADTIMISNAGEAAVSGVSLVDMFNNLIISVFAALATGGAVVTSQLLGAKKKDDACRSIMQLIVSSLFLTVVLTAFCIVARRGIVSAFFGSIEKDVFDNATMYL
ncbi:MAG: MATE family efflux transporter, partial [Lachnospiraceae bacterium]|nr:MATE family efflux transporter [Lachnospiraceae bacterium]